MHTRYWVHKKENGLFRIFDCFEQEYLDGEYQTEELAREYIWNMPT